MAKAQALMTFINDPYVDQMKIRIDYLSAIGVDNPEDYVSEPDAPGPNPLDEATLGQMHATIGILTAQMKSVEAKIQRDNMKTLHDMQTENIKVDNDTTATITKGTKDLADAEAAEAGAQVDNFMKITQGIANDKGNTKQGIVPKLEETPDNTVGIPSDGEEI